MVWYGMVWKVPPFWNAKSLVSCDVLSDVFGGVIFHQRREFLKRTPAMSNCPNEKSHQYTLYLSIFRRASFTWWRASSRTERTNQTLNRVPYPFFPLYYSYTYLPTGTPLAQKGSSANCKDIFYAKW